MAKTNTHRIFARKYGNHAVMIATERDDTVDYTDAHLARHHRQQRAIADARDGVSRRGRMIAFTAAE